MEIPSVTGFAKFVRERLAEVSDTLAPLWSRRAAVDVLPAGGREHPDHAVLNTARQLALVIVGAAAPFATTSYSRARLIRQMHASGLLSDEHVVRTEHLLQIAHDAPPR